MKEISCPRIGEFDEEDIVSVSSAMGGTPCLPLTQSWMPVADQAFRLATVRLGWREDNLFILAEMEDDDIFSDATRLNQRTWELGDAFEIFLKARDLSEYVEFHVTPNNQRLQLRFPDTATLREAQRTGVFEPFLITSPDAVTSRVWVNPGERRWTVLVSVPGEVVQKGCGTMVGREWKYSFSRYDYTRGVGKPILSSTSLHREPDFHSQAEWGTLRFQS